MVGGIATIAGAISGDMGGRLPRQHKAQRDGLALLTATMLDVRSANLMDLAASLPRAAGRPDMRHQWISRLLGNGLIEVDAVMAMGCTLGEPGNETMIIDELKPPTLGCRKLRQRTADMLAVNDYDAIVVGGGHNGLTAAAYLARAGRRVAVLERRSVFTAIVVSVS